MPVVKPPNRNLPESATPWGRWVEDNISGFDSRNSQQQQSLDNTLKAVDGSLTALGTLISRSSVPATEQNLVNTFAITTGNTTQVSATIPVPDGAKSAIVNVSVAWTLRSSVTAGSTPWINQYVNMVSNLGASSRTPGLVQGPQIIAPPASGVFFTGGASFSGTYNQLNAALPSPISTLNVSFLTDTSGYVVATNSDNQIILNVTALFLAN